MSDNNDWSSPPSAPGLPGQGEGWGDEHEPSNLHDMDREAWGTAPGARPGGPPAPGQAPGTWGAQNQPPGGPPAGPPGGPPAGPPGGPPGGPPPGGPGPMGAPPQPSPYGYQQPNNPNAMMPAPNTHLKPASNQLDNNDVVALVVTFFLPGVGHMMLGQAQKGVAILALTFFTCGLSYFAVLLVLYDAYMVALARKKRPVQEWEFLPQ